MIMRVMDIHDFEWHYTLNWRLIRQRFKYRVAKHCVSYRAAFDASIADTFTIETSKLQMADSSPPPKRIKVTVSVESEIDTEAGRKRPELTDVVFVVGGKEFPAHKKVLASKSEYFKSLLYGGMQEVSMKTIELSERSITPAAFEKVLQFAYTGSLDVDEEIDVILDIICAADYLIFDDLKLILGEHVAKNIDSTTVLPLFAFSRSNDSLQAHDVCAKCLKFIEQTANTSNLLKSKEFLKLPEEHLKELISCDTFVAPEVEILDMVLRWKEHNEKSVDEMAKIIECIRLGRFTMKEMFTIAQPSGLFSETRLLAGVRVLGLPLLSEIYPRGKKCPTKEFLKECKYLCYRKSREVTLQLTGTFLANRLCFEIDTDSSYDKLGYYSYTVSADFSNARDRVTLFDYNQFQCRGRQVLFFPTIPIKNLTVKITGMERDVQPNSKIHKISSLKLSDNIIPFKLKSDGVIAPLQDYMVEFVQFLTKDTTSHSAEAFFYQPYSVSTLTIEVKHEDPHVYEFYVTVQISTSKGLHQIKKKMTHVDIRNPIVVEFEEKVVGYVKLVLTNALPEQSDIANEGRMTIHSIKCRSSAIADEVDMDKWTPFLTGKSK